jgi:hypothetical protein
LISSLISEGLSVVAISWFPCAAVAGRGLNEFSA